MALTSDYRTINTEGWTDEQVETLSRFCIPMMTIGMKEISDETIDEIYFRFRIRERLGVSIFVEKIDPRKFFSLLQSYKGIKTNVGPEKRHSWINRMVKGIVQDLQREGMGEGDTIRS
jgi:hypothetical protein